MAYRGRIIVRNGLGSQGITQSDSNVRGQTEIMADHRHQNSREDPIDSD